MEIFSKWKENVLSKIKVKIKHLKSNMKHHQTEPILRDDKVKNCLHSLHRKFIIVTFDKAAID